METDSNLRASDAERSATADFLRRHHAEGRLDTAELEERIERCYAAKTRGELAELTADLPGRHLDRRVASRRGRHAFVPAPLLVLVALLIALSVITHGHVLWLVWPFAFFAFIRVRRRRGWRMVP